MRKRFLLNLMTAICFTAVICGCNSAAETNTTGTEDSTKQEAATNETEENNVGISNPIVEVDGVNDFEDQLGIELMDDAIPGEKKYSIIDNKLAQIQFEAETVNGETATYTFRATKEDLKDEALHGIYDSNLIDGSSIEYEGSLATVNLDYIHANTEGYDIWTWNNDGVNYSLTLDKDSSQMQISEILDAVMIASKVEDINSADNSAEFSGKSVSRLTNDVDVTNLIDCEYPCTIDLSTIKKTDNGVTVDMEIYTMDLYDAVDMTTLEPGDNIVVDGSDMIVETVEEKHGVIYVNGGIEEGGAEFISNGGGTFRYFGFDDHATYTLEGSVNVEIGNDAKIIDKSDLDHPEGIIITGEEFYDYASNSDNYLDFYYINSTARFEDGKLVEINRKFIP